MATYLRIGGVGAAETDIQIAGDVSESRHEGWIELTEFSFGSSGKGGGGDDEEEGEEEDSGDEGGAKKKPAAPKGGSDALRAGGFKMSKWAGQDSPKLIDWALTGKLYDLQIDCCREVGEPYMRIFITKARVKSLEQSAEESEVTEEVQIQFETIAFEAMSFGKDGTRLSKARAATKAHVTTVAARSGPVTRSESGKGVGKRMTKTPAQEAVDRAAGRLWDGNEEPEFVQEDRVLSIDKVGGIEFSLGGFVGSEEMSGLFSYRLEVTSTNLNVEAKDVIGKPVGFRIEDHADIDSDRAGSPREFHGVIAEIYAGQKSVDHRDYTLVVVPWLWMLRKRTDCRIFQKKTVVEIVEAVFGNLGFSDFDKSNIRGTYPKLDFCVQYRETDFDFVSRLLEEFGIFYFFRMSAGMHKMILADESVAHAACETNGVKQGEGSVDERHVRRWTKHLTHVSGMARYRDYNFSTPTDTLEAQESSVVDLPKKDSYVLYDYPGRYPTVSDGGKRAKARIEAEEVSHCIVDGDGNVESFSAGTKFKIESHDCEEEEGQEYVLTGVVHRVYMMPSSDLKPRLYYANEFECIPKRVVFRPARVTPRPVVKGPQTAVVVGTSGEEIDPDKYGAVKVQFHWDREGQKDENSSCFVRVSQPIAGKNWGGLWLPRIGQEVVVEFLEGDPDRPLITGSVYNEDNMPPYELPANKTQSVMKTRSTKEGKAENFNELRFEDKKGSEQIYFHAEKDFDRVVENNDTLVVGKDGEGSQTITIEKDRTIEVKEGNDTYTVKKGDRTATVETGNDTYTVKKGDRTLTIETGKDTHTVKTGDRLVSVDTGNDTHTVKMGNRAVNVDMGNDTLTIKMGNQTTKLNLGKSTTDAMQGIELKVGGSSIKIDQMGITLKGMMVTVDGSIKTDVKGLICQVTGSAMLKAGGGITMLG